MKAIKIIVLFTLLFSLKGFSQSEISFTIRAEKQAMSTPMTPLYDVFFVNYYYSRPVNIELNGSNFRMYYDNGATVTKKEIIEAHREKEVYNNKVEFETIYFTNKQDVTDTVSVQIDYSAKYIQVVIPTKNSEGEYIGYTSYIQPANVDELALN